jgi:hypothetical protein
MIYRGRHGWPGRPSLTPGLRRPLTVMGEIPADGPAGRLVHDPPACGGRRHRGADWLPHVPRHRITPPTQRRCARAGNGGARESAHDQALRSHEGAAYAGRSGKDQAVRPELCYRTSKGAARRRRKRVDPTVASYALRGDGLIFTTFDGGLGLSRRNASATLSASCTKRYGFWRTRSPSAGENAAMSA